MAGVKIHNLCKSFQVDSRNVQVLQNLSTELPDSQITIILGHSGCGKTTLLRILGGFDQSYSGQIHVPDNEKIGMVFQEPRLMPWLTVWKNITFGLKRTKRDDIAIRQLIDTVGLAGFINAYPDQLSGGMQQRAALARVLAYDPDLILMDEPFAALDYFTRETMQNELIRIHSMHSKTIVFVTHSIDEALLLGGKIIVLEQGKIGAEHHLTDIPYPRDLLSEPLIEIKKSILSTITKQKGVYK